jgi:hypothetical protein
MQKKTKMNKITYYILIIIALTACGRSNNETDKEEKEKLVEEKYEKIISELTDKYSIKYSLDTLRYDYSIQFEDMLNTKYQLISFFRIQDIYKQDSISYVKVETGFYPTYYLNLRISETEQEKLLALEKSFFSQANAVMIIALQEIRKIDLTFESYPADQNYCSIEFESSMSFTGKGQVIEVQILNE